MWGAAGETDGGLVVCMAARLFPSSSESPSAEGSDCQYTHTHTPLIRSVTEQLCHPGGHKYLSLFQRELTSTEFRAPGWTKSVLDCYH